MNEVLGARFFYKQHFYKQRQAEIGNQARAKQHPEAELCYSKIIRILHPHYPKIIGRIFKNVQKKQKKTSVPKMKNENEK